MTLQLLSIVHPPLSIQLQVEGATSENGLVYNGFYRDFNSANFQDIAMFLDQFNWDILFCSQSIEEMLNILYEIIFIAIDKFVPLKRFPIWFSVDLKNFIIEKKKAHKKYKNTHSVDDYQEFSRLRLLCKSLTQECYNQYVYCTELAINLNIKNFGHLLTTKEKTAAFLMNLNT